MEIHHLAVQLDTQFAGIDEKLDNERALTLVRYRSTVRHVRLWSPFVAPALITRG
jgi:hypothetical protein